MNGIIDIVKKVHGDGNVVINEDTDIILDLGFDSMKIIQLVSELEVKFDIEFSEELIVLANFNSINNIKETIERCTPA